MALFNQYEFPSKSVALGIQESVSSRLPSPWLDPASTELPDNITQIFKFCELLWNSNGTYAMAMKRVAAYFITKVKVSDVEGEDSEKWYEFLNDDLGINKVLLNEGENFLCYGNTLSSPRVAVNRVLSCPKCGQAAPLPAWQNLKFRDGDIMSVCRKCSYAGIMNRHDFRATDRSAVSVHLWNIHHIRIKHNPLTNRSIYHYVMPPNLAALLRQGDPDYLADTPWEFIESALKRKPLRFFSDQIFHLREPAICGVETQGNGLPRGLSNFRQAYLTQALNRLNMVMAMEYSMPFRALTPQSGGGNMDPTMSLDLQDVASRLSALLADWKRDPAAFHVFPTPINYTSWGGEGLQMASHEIQQEAMSQLLNGLGVPVDFFQGSFKSERTFVPVLRLMERSWEDLVAGYNAFLGWLAEVMSGIMRWKKPKLVLEPTTTANDIELRNILLDLWLKGAISSRRALSTIGIDNPTEEKRNILREQLDEQEDADLAKLRQQKTTDNMQYMAQQQPIQGGGAQYAGPNDLAGGGAGGQEMLPSQGAGQGAMRNTPTRPDDIIEQAQQIAQQLISQPENERHAPLKQLRDQSPLLHAAVMSALEKMRQQIASDATNQVASQSGQQGAQQ